MIDETFYDLLGNALLPEEEQGFFPQINKEDSMTKEEAIEKYVDLVMNAADVASESEGFLMIAVKNEADGDDIVFTPYLISACMNEASVSLIEAQIVQLAALSQQELAIRKIRNLRRGKK